MLTAKSSIPLLFISHVALHPLPCNMAAALGNTGGMPTALGRLMTRIDAGYRSLACAIIDPGGA
jgi:hypothetical protein